MIRATKWPFDILPAKLIKIIKKRKEIKNNSSKMTKNIFHSLPFLYISCIFMRNISISYTSSILANSHPLNCIIMLRNYNIFLRTQRISSILGYI